MVDKKIHDFTPLGATPADNDLFVMVDVSDTGSGEDQDINGKTKKVTRSEVLNIGTDVQGVLSEGAFIDGDKTKLDNLPTTFATVASTGNYNDLNNLPDLTVFDEVEQYANFPTFPSTGDINKFYLAQDTGELYRWTGSNYVVISGKLSLGETSTTAYRGDRGKDAYDHSQITSGNPHGTTANDVNGLATFIDNRLSVNNVIISNPTISAGNTVVDNIYRSTQTDRDANRFNPAFANTLFVLPDEKGLYFGSSDNLIPSGDFIESDPVSGAEAIDNIFVATQTQYDNNKFNPAYANTLWLVEDTPAIHFNTGDNILEKNVEAVASFPLDFLNDKIYGTFASPLTATSFFSNYTNAKIGIVQKMYLTGNWSIPSEMVNIGLKNYDSAVTNIVFFEYSASGRTEYWVA